MKIPGFTAEFSLNESRECYAMMQKDAITRGRAVVVPQQIQPRRKILVETGFYSLDCGEFCCSIFGPQGPVDCELLWEYFDDSRPPMHLGSVQIPNNCFVGVNKSC